MTEMILYLYCNYT